MNRTDNFCRTIIVHTHGWYCVVCLVTVGDLANEIQCDCGNIGGNFDSLFTELYKL